MILRSSSLRSFLPPSSLRFISSQNPPQKLDPPNFLSPLINIKNKTLHTIPSGVKTLYSSYLRSQDIKSSLITLSSLKNPHYTQDELPRSLRLHLLNTKKSLRKSLPSAVLCTLPILGYAWCAVVIFFPRYTTCSLFWTYSEVLQFNKIDAEIRKEGRRELREYLDSVVGVLESTDFGSESISDLKLKLNNIQLNNDTSKPLAKLLNTTSLPLNLVPNRILKKWVYTSLEELEEEFRCLERNYVNLSVKEKQNLKLGCEDVERWLKVGKGLGRMARGVLMAYL